MHVWSAENLVIMIRSVEVVVLGPKAKDSKVVKLKGELQKPTNFIPYMLAKKWKRL